MPHIHELYDYTIAVFIVYDGKVLLVSHPRYNKWIPIGGHIEMNEDPEMALFREIKEETSLNVTILSTKPEFSAPRTKQLLVPNFLEVHEANPPHRHISFTYFGVADSPDFVLSKEHDAMRWFSRDDLLTAEYELSPEIIFYAQSALELAAPMT